MLTSKLIEIKYALITLMLLLSLLTLDRTQAFSGLDTLIADFFALMISFGFAGIFIVALVGNCTLLVQMPYTVPLLSLSLGGASLDRMLLLGVASGIGAACGEVISYGIAEKILGKNPGLEKSSLFQWVKRTVNDHPRMTPLLVFVWAASVLPDDTVIIPLAMVRYSIKKIWLPLFTGKIVHNLMIAAVFYYFTGWSADQVPMTVQADLALGILILFVMVIFYQVEKVRSMRHLSITEGSQ